ncbi:hypothetical protein C8R45DRAFT_184313 [Mycena sanguinolenta]|nr:hypothetical protein C8R45DRAFT_184313 [Mycena sanguinolenta]
MPVVRRNIAYRKSRRLRKLDDDEDLWEPYDAAMLESALPSLASVTTVKAEPAVVKAELELEPKADVDTDLNADGELDTDLDADGELDTDLDADAALDAELDARYGVEFPHVEPGGHVPRPRNAFICFRSIFVARHKEKTRTGAESSSSTSGSASTSDLDLALDRLVGLSASTSTSSSTRNVNQTTLSSDAGRTWNALSAADRAPLDRMALREKQKHARAYPWYRYAPNGGGGVVRKPKPKPRHASKLKTMASTIPKSLRKSAPTPRRRASTSTSTSPSASQSTPDAPDPDLDAFFTDAANMEDARRWRAHDSDAKKRRYPYRARCRNSDDEEDGEYKPDPPASRPRAKLNVRRNASAPTRPRRVSWASPVAKVEPMVDDDMDCADMRSPSLNADEEEEEEEEQKPECNDDNDITQVDAGVEMPPPEPALVPDTEPTLEPIPALDSKPEVGDEESLDLPYKNKTDSDSKPAAVRIPVLEHGGGLVHRILRRHRRRVDRRRGYGH